jgi:5-methylcytosine-specific restriction endonuclease McrA
MFVIDYCMYLYIKYTHRRIDYPKYLQSKHWKRIKYKTIKKANYRCQICGTRKYSLQVHHCSYDNLYWERKGELISVCPRCHKTIHYYIWNNLRKAG